MLALANKLTNSTQPIYRFVNKYSIDFDGVDDCIITDGADTVAQNTTYSFWCKSSSTIRNYGVFGHGGQTIGAFHINWGLTSPMLYLGTNYSRTWYNIPQQDDGEWHHWVVYSDTNDITNSKLYVDGVLQTVASTTSSGSASYTESLTIAADRATGGNHFEGNIDEFAVFDRELTQDEITRMYNTYYSPNRVANGNFSQIGNEEVTNGDFSQIGSELVTNGDFATDSDWTKGTGWTISDNKGVAVLVNNTFLQQNQTTITNKTYKVVYTLSDYENGSVRFQFSGGGGNTIGTVVSANGTYTEYIKSTLDHTVYRFKGTSSEGGFTGSIDNVSVKEVGQGFTFGTGWGMGDGKAICDGSQTGNTSLQQSGVAGSGKIYKLQFDLTVDAGFINYVNLGGWIDNTNLTTSDTYTYYTTTTTNTDNLGIAGDSNFVGSIDNLSVKEVGQGWTFGTGWSTDGTKAICVGDSSHTSLTANYGFIAGRSYKVSFDITVTSGTFAIQLVGSGSDIGSSISTTTINYTETIIPTANRNTFSIRSNDGNGVGTVDNIVVQELKHDATNLMLNAGAYQSANPLITSTNSMEFDGVDDYLIVNEGYDYNNRTFATWFNSADNTQTGNHGNTILSQTSSSNGNRWHLRIDDSDNQVKIYNGTSIILLGNINTTTIEENRWYNVVMTEDGTTLKFYINGIIQGSGTVTLLSASDDVFTFGQEFDGGGASDFFKGEMTEAGVWDRVLTSLEVASLYNQGMPTNLLVNRNDYQSGNPTVFNTKQVDFDGTDDYLTIGNIDYSSYSNISISTWVNSSDTDGCIIQKESIFRLIKTAANTVVFTVATSNNSWYNKTVTNTNMISGWNHIVGLYDGSNLKLYVNGSNVATTTGISGTILNNSNEVFFGRTTSSYYSGNISQLGIFSSALTSDEVSSLYNHGLPIDLTTNQAAYESSSNLVGYWRMGSGVNDSYPIIYDQTNATLSSELVVNGDFESGTSGWSAYYSGTLNNTGNALNVVDAGGGGARAATSITTVIGKTYKFVSDILQIQSTSTTIAVSNNINLDGAFINSTITTPTNGVTVYFTATATTTFIGFKRNGNGVGFTNIYDNVSVKQVNGNPAIMTNQTASDIENGSPYANIVQNGTFDTDSDWTKGTGVSISSGSANFLNVSANLDSLLQFSVAPKIGIMVKVDYEIKNYSNGSIRVSFGGTPLGITRSSNGFYSETFIVVSNLNLTFKAQSDGTTLSIDNVSVSEVNTGLQGYWKMGSGINDEFPVIYDQTNPTLGADVYDNDIDEAVNGGGWTDNGDGTFTVTGTGIVSPGIGVRDTNASYLTQGKVYKWTVDGDNTTLAVYNSGFGLEASGTSPLYFTATSQNRLYISPTNAITSTYSNVLIKEVQGNPSVMTNMVEGNITNQFPLTKIRNYYRMGDGILDGFPIIQDQTSPNLAHIPTTNLVTESEDFNAYKIAGSTVTPNSTTSPDGTNSGILVTQGIATLCLRVSNVVAPSTTYTFSGYFKSSSSVTQVILDITDNANTTFDLTNKWQRFSVTAESRPGGSPYHFVDVATNGGQGDTFYAWGLQVEEQTQATAYIKSDGIAAVRKATTTNLALYSEDFSQSYWSKINGVTVTSSTIISPDSVSLAQGLQFDGTDNGRIEVNVGSYSNLTQSVYLKVASGTASVQIGFTGGSQLTVTVTNEWKRFEYFQASGTFPRVRCNDNKLIYVWGLQVEEQTQAETYAKTTGLPVTIDLFTENNYGTMTNMSANDIVEDTP